MSTRPSTPRPDTLALLAASAVQITLLVAVPRRPGPLLLGLGAVVVAGILGASLLSNRFRGPTLGAYLVAWVSGSGLVLLVGTTDRLWLPALLLVAFFGLLALAIHRYGILKLRNSVEGPA